MTEDDIIVEIKMPLKNRKKDQDALNNALDSLKNTLQTNYGTSNIQVAAAMAATTMAAQIAINIATMGMDISGIGNALSGIADVSDIPMLEEPLRGGRVSQLDELREVLRKNEYWEPRTRINWGARADRSSEEIRRLKRLGGK